MAKLTAPNVNLFDPDALEQIFAKGVTARDNTAGLSAAWLLSSRADRMNDQDRYLGALNTTNQMDAALQRQEVAAKLREQGMKSATDLIKEGFTPTSLNSGADLFSDLGSGDNYAKMLQALTQSKITANNSKGASGGGGKPTTTVQSVMMPWGAAGPTTITSKNADPAAATGANSAALATVVERMQKNPQAYTADQKKQVMQLMMQQSSRTQPGIED